LALVSPTQGSPAQAPSPGRSSTEPPRAPRVLLVAGEDGDADDFEVAASAFAHLLADRHGLRTTQVRAHSAEIGHAADALAEAEVAILFVRIRTWPEPERKRVGDFVARGGRLVALRADAVDAERRTREEPRVLALPFDDTGPLEQEGNRRRILRWILPSLDRKPADPRDVAFPPADPLTA